MSDYKLPELPSDEDLGIDDADLDKYADKGKRGLSSSELLAFLDEEPGTPDTRPGKAKPAATPAPKRTEPPRSVWKGPATLLALLGVAAVSSSLTGLPEPMPVNAPEGEFSSGRAMAHVLSIARQAHPIGSPEHAAVRTYLLNRLGEMGLEPQVQTAAAVVQEGPEVRAATVRNVLARLAGSESTGAVLVTAHYDGHGNSRAAGDDASGVGAILEGVRALRTGPALRNDLIVLFTDGEEAGLMGARAFLEEHAWADDVAFVLALDKRGAEGPVHMFETGEENGWAVRALGRGNPAPLANSVAPEIYRRMPNRTDFTVFRDSGLQGLNFAAMGAGNVYHQAFDAPERLSEVTLQHDGIQLLGMLRHLGQQDLSTTDGPDAVYFTLPILGLVVYPALWVLPLAALLLLAFVGALMWTRTRGARPWAIGVGAGISVAALAVSYAAGLWLVGWLPRFHPEVGSLFGAWINGGGRYLVALVAATFVVVVGLHGLARRWVSARELALGALAVPVILATAGAIVAPMGAMNLQWPALAAVLAVLALPAHPAGARAWIGWVIALLLAIPVLATTVQLVEGLSMAMTLRAAPIIAALVAVVLYLVLPALEALREPNAWWAPLLGLLAAVAFFSLGLLGAGPSDERPLFSTLVYTYDHGSGEAVWITAPLDHPADTVARAWAEAAAGTEFVQRQPMSDFLGHAEPVPVALGDAGIVPAPRVVTLADTTTEAVRTVRVGIRSEVGAELVQVRFDPADPTRAVALNGDRLPGEPPRLIEHWGEPDSLIVIDLEVPAGREPGFHLVEHLLRPQEIVGPSAFERPPHLAPDLTRRSDRAILRSGWGSLATAAPPDSAAAPAGAAPPDTAAAGVGGGP